LNENEIGLILQHLCRLCSPQTPDNIFRGVLLNRFPPGADSNTRQEYLKHFTQGECVQDQTTGCVCPMDKRMIGRALRENPDKENLYPVQINGVKELGQR
jgi:hypothetical protein